jgi:hypothetical protein
VTAQQRPGTALRDAVTLGVEKGNGVADEEAERLGAASRIGRRRLWVARAGNLCVRYWRTRSVLVIAAIFRPWREDGARHCSTDVKGAVRPLYRRRIKLSRQHQQGGKDGKAPL